MSLYVDGKRLVSRTGITRKLNLATIGRLTVGSGHHQTGRFPGRMRHFRVVPYALYEDDFTSNLPVWVGYRTPYVSATSPVAISGVPNEALTSVSLQATASNSNTVTFALQSGSTLPSGVSLSSAGVISGTPTAESSATCNIVASAVGCIDAVVVVNFAIAEPSASPVPQQNLNYYNAVVSTVMPGDDSATEQTFSFDESGGTGYGEHVYYAWADSMSRLIYIPDQDGTEMLTYYSTTHKWTITFTGDIQYYCDDDNPNTGTWYPGEYMVQPTSMSISFVSNQAPA